MHWCAAERINKGNSLASKLLLAGESIINIRNKK
jgi:hypothetical protein